MTLFQMLKTLSAKLGVSGAEESLSACIADLMRPYCDTLHTDALGNLICEKKTPGAKETLLLAAHMDEIGFLVTEIDEKGYVHLAPLGYQESANCAYTPLRFENGARGVLVPPYDTKNADLEVQKFVCDLGAKSRATAKKLVAIGERAATVSPLTRLSATRVSGRALDNKAGVAALIRTAALLAEESKLPYNLIYLFSAQEEVGCRGAQAAAFAVEPDFCINLDVTDAMDVPGQSGHLKLGKGPCVKYKDQLVLPSRKMIAHLNRCAKDAKIPVQEEIIVRGGTDTGVIQSSRAGVLSGALSIPQRYAHTDAEIIDLADLEETARLCYTAAKTKIEG